MRSRLGTIAALSLAGVSLLVGASAAGAATTSPQGPPVDESTTTTSSTVEESTTTTTTTTTPPPPLVIELPPPPVRVTPSRGTAAQVTDTLPPPPSTTAPPPPPAPSVWEVPAGSGSGRRVVYSKSRMRVWTVESDGTVSKTHLVSGRRTWNQPSPGTYSVFSRSRYTCNIDNPHICWRFMVRFTKGPDGDNIGFHEIPTNLQTGQPLQSISQLGQALSGGCVRQAPWDAAYMWDWAPIGTQVVVLG